MISIIIPVYNAEKYIARTVNSIVSQYNHNLEIIIINDGSTDGTQDILKKYKNYKYIKIINQKNSGVSNSRNIGLSMASGDIIMFCDSDDEYDNKLIEHIEFDLKTYQTIEYIVFGRLDINGDIKKFCNDHHDLIVYNNINEFILNRFCKGLTTFSVCNKVFISKIIKDNNIKFNEDLKYSEDLDFNLKYLSFCNNVLEDYRVNYLRYCNDFSSIYRKIPDFFQKNIKIIDTIKSENNKYDEDIYKMLKGHFAIVYLNRLFSGIDKNNYSYKIFRKECIDVYNFLKNNQIKLDFEKNTRNNLFFYLFNTKKFFTLYIISVKIGNIVRSIR